VRLLRALVLLGVAAEPPPGAQQQLCHPPMMFFFLALSTGLGTLLCLLVGVIAGAALVALRPFLTGIRRDNP
jgi:hypothetical protein